MSVEDKIIQLMGDDFITNSMIRHEPNAEKVLRLLRPRVLLETGTFKGISTTLWAEHCETVITVDIAPRPEAFELWEKAGVSDKIASVKVLNDTAKKALIRQLSFDFAFIDGDHSGEGVRFDFECVKTASAVMFHDYKPDWGEFESCTNARFPDSARYINSLEPRRTIFGPHCSKMALWLNPERIDAEQRETIEEACRFMPHV